MVVDLENRSPEHTHDTLFSGKLSCWQNKSGYRFSVDAILLAHFIRPSKCTILDLGAGSGIISLLLAYRNPSVQATCIELQDSLCTLIEKNILTNALDKQIRLIQGDLREISQKIPSGSFDYVVCNPPYYQIGTGKKNPSEEQAIARHEMKADQNAIVKACKYAVRTKGRVALIYPASRAVSLLANLKQSGLEPKRVQPVYPYPGSQATQILVEAVCCGGEGLLMLEPFFIYESQLGAKNRVYSAQMERLYNE